MQNRYNLVNREDERELIPMCLDMGVGMIPFSPLGRGLLAGTRDRSGERRTKRAISASPDRPADYDIQDAVLEVAGRLGLPPARVAMAWLVHKPGICTPIVGATAPVHITDAIASLDVELSEERRIYPRTRIPSQTPERLRLIRRISPCTAGASEQTQGANLHALESEHTALRVWLLIHIR